LPSAVHWPDNFFLSAERLSRRRPFFGRVFSSRELDFPSGQGFCDARFDLIVLLSGVSRLGMERRG
jgi:hypothetical protein